MTSEPERDVVDPLAEFDGCEVVDPIDRHRYTLYTDDPVTPASVDTVGFRYPVDAAVERRRPYGRSGTRGR